MQPIDHSAAVASYCLHQWNKIFKFERVNNRGSVAMDTHGSSSRKNKKNYEPKSMKISSVVN